MESSDSPLPNPDDVSHPDGVQQTEDFRPLEEPDKPLEDSGVDASKNNRSLKSNASVCKKTKSSNGEAAKKTKAKKVVESTSKRQSDEAPSKKKEKSSAVICQTPLGINMGDIGISN